MAPPRAAVPARLEAVLFPRPEPAAATAGVGPGPSAVLLAADRADRHRTRRFRTAWDAADWLAAHRPDIDLARPRTPPAGYVEAAERAKFVREAAPPPRPVVK